MLDIYSLTINSNGDIFAGAEGGVYMSKDDGDSWILINSGLSFNTAYSFVINSLGEIFAGTSGGYVFRSVNSTTSIIGLNNRAPSVFVLTQNYPNPFNPTTTIKYSIPKLSFVTIKIYDVIGSEVATLVNEEKPFGNYELNWSAANLPSGVYFYQLKAGNYINIKKMILLK
jgi:hypothetical protein